MLGQKRDYLTIRILHNDMTVQVPAENAEAVASARDRREDGHESRREGAQGRRHTDAEELESPLQAQPRQDEDRRRAGACEVVRNLSLRDHEKGLSTGEKQMFVKAKKILASELMYAKGMDARRGRRVARGRPVQRRQQRQEAHDARKTAAAASWSCMSVGRARRCRKRRAARLDRPGVRDLRDRPLLAEPLERLEARATGSTRSWSWCPRAGGARDPARRGAGRRQGRRLRHGRRDASLVGAYRRRRGSRRRVGDPRARCGAATRERRDRRARVEAARGGLSRRGPRASRRGHD